MRHYIVEEKLQKRISESFPLVGFDVDSEVLLYAQPMFLLNSGRKKTLVRYNNENIRIPGSDMLPLFKAKEDDSFFKQHAGKLWVPTMTIKSVGELTDEDGVNDGLSGRDELVEVIRSVCEKDYGPVTDDKLVSIYTIHRI